MSGHPSFLQLDRHALGAGDGTTARHLEACAECRAHLGRLGQPVSPPEWVRALEDQPRSRWLRWPQLAALGALACAAVVFAMLPGRRDPEDLGRKGSPSVAVYVKRGERVSLWDGSAPFRAGDGLQLRVMPSGFPHATVASVEGASLRRLYSASVPPEGTTLLPLSFTLDAAPGPEVLLLVFSAGEPSDHELKNALVELPRGRRQWATRLTLAKGETR